MSENAQNIAFFTRFVGAESAGLSIFNPWLTAAVMLLLHYLKKMPFIQ